MRAVAGLLILLGLLAVGYFIGRDYVRRHPQDFPWPPLELSHPVGRFTASKIAGLGDEPARCRALLANVSAAAEAAPDKVASPDCGYEDGVRLTGRDPRYSPAGLVTSCPVAAALHLLEQRVIAPAAERHLGQRVERVLHAGSYNCRRLYGRSEGTFSEHATADAVDIIGFRLVDGTEVSVLKDWDGGGAKSAFLKEVRDGSCGLFSTVLSPDYNAAHRDHLHLDVADRGQTGWTMCR